MLKFRLDEKRTEPKPDRRLGIKLEAPVSKRGLAGKLDAYVPPELRYDYRTPSVFAQYKVLTGVFVALGLGLLIFWATVARDSAPTAVGKPVQAPKDQPIYIEALPQ